ncbi:MAG: hypothetical protein LBQ01_07275, partial [Prevotellaceae bacterium]|nr:hypothetical protein [Prevotellaceae bacterium]
SQYFDADALNLDLWYSDGASWLPVAGASGLRVSNITYDGDSVAFQITASVPSSMDVCNMAVVLRKNNSENSSKNPWLADSVSIAVPTPAYEITSQPLPVCQMAVNASIGEKPISGYQYEWNPATYLSGGGIGTPLDFTYDYMTSPLPDGGVLQYLVTVTRPAGCKSTDTVFVELKGIPAVKAVDDIEVCHGSGLSVNFEDNTNSGGSPTEFSWVIEAVTGDISKTNLPGSGTGNINKSPIVNPTGASIFAKYIVTPHKDGCDGVADTFNIKVLPSSILNYPDIRLNTCPGTTVNLSKYIDTVEYPTVVWKSVYGAVSPSGEVVIDGSRTSGVLTFTYEVTNRCVPAALTRKAYLKILSGNIRRQHNTLAVCYDQAEALQINQIIGIEAGGTFTYTADNSIDLTPYIRESSTYGGAITMNGRAIYEAGARTVTVTYTPAPDSCLDGKIFTVTIVLF